MYPNARFVLPVISLITSSLAQDDPQPLVIPASEYFEGNDGPWSTFNIRVGTPEQDIRVLISTASPQTMVPLSEIGCSTQVFSDRDVPPDCAVSRGNLFNPNESSSWIDLGQYAINQDGVGLEANLGYNVHAQFGLEHLGIGLTGPSLANQTVAGFATAQPFYLGIFGLNNQPVNFTVLGNHTAPSFLTTLKDQGKIPSLTWSYTAGAKYRLKQVYGQLIFGGYDTSRFRSDGAVSFTMAEDITRDLVVTLQSISYSGSTSRTLLQDPIDNVYLDSTDANLWLPDTAVRAFEEAFGLVLDEDSGLYLVNDTHREKLLDSDARVSFRLSDVKGGGGDTVTITLPFAAFDLMAETPLVKDASHYFPLRRAENSSQYTLGRVFFQEAYLSADYERKVFNVSSCVWNQGAEANIVTIPPRDPNPDTNASPSIGNGTGLSGGQIAGIVIGSILGALLVTALVTIILLRKRRKWLKKGFSAANPTVLPETSASILNGPVFNSDPPSHSTPRDVVLSPLDSSAGRGGLSAAGTRSTGPGTDEHTSSNSPNSTRAATASNVKNIRGGSTPELDGTDTLVRPDTELDGHEIPSTGNNDSQHVPGVFELPGSEVDVQDEGDETEKGRRRRGVMNREISTVGDLPKLFPVVNTATTSQSGSKLGGGGGHSQPRQQRAMSVSTMGTTTSGSRDHDHDHEGESASDRDLVSPSSPASTSHRQHQSWGPSVTGSG